MACDTCSHTLARLCIHEGMAFSHCDRCGTVVVEFVDRKGPVRRVYRPKLVERCREFIRMIDDTTAGRWFKQQCHISGVTEAVLTPEERPPT